MEIITTEKILRIAPLLPVWALLAVAAAMAYLAYNQIKSLRERLPGSRLPLLLSLLRAAAFVVVLLIMLNPVAHQLNYLSFPPHVAVLVDDSASMSVDDGGASRLDRVKTILKGEAWQSLTLDMKDYVFDYYSFGQRLESVGPDGVRDLKADQVDTYLSLALSQLAGSYPDAPLAGVVLFTDGKERADTGGGEIGVPVVPVGAGTGGSFRDVRISKLRAPDFAFLHKPVNIDLEVQTIGYEETRLPLVMRKDGKIVSTEELTFREGERGKQLSLSFVPDRLGLHEISVEVVPQPDEAVMDNNRVELVLPVERDKIRVLMISGRPSWNYRFLRQALKNDGSVDLISFIILRTPTDPVNVPQSQLSLIPFPADVLFTEELGSFDLIIFDNFAFRLNLPPEYMKSVRDAVAGGNSFLMIGGDESFYEGGYDGTPIEDILPVVLDRRSGGYVQGSFPFLLTEQGVKHPVMRASGEVAPGVAWGGLPSLSGFNRTLRAKPGTVVLGVNSYQRSEFGPLPVLALMKFGKGRTAALLTDGLWRWNLQAVGQGKNNRLYLMLVRQLIRWLVKDPSLDQIKLWGQVLQPRGGGEGRLLLRTEVYHDDFSPASDAVLNVTAAYPSGRTVQPDYQPGGRPGEYVVEMVASEDGVYRFTVEALARGKLIGRGEFKVQYASAKAELQDAAPNEGLLRSIAEATGGKYFRADEFSSSAAAQMRSLFRMEPLRRLIERRVEPMLDNVYMFMLLTSLLALEWFIRRRRGLV